MREEPRASGRMLLYLDGLYRFHGVDIRKHARGLGSIPTSGPVPTWITWKAFVTLVDRLGELVGSEGIARAMRGLSDDYYAEFRAARWFMPDPLGFFFHYHHTIAPSVTSGCRLEGRMRDDGRVALHLEMHPSVRPSAHFLAGSIALIELFPTHFDLSPAKLETLSGSDFHLDAIAEFPSVSRAKPWGKNVEELGDTTDLTPREREVLVLVSQGLTNRDVADRLGTSFGTVRNQLASIMRKMRAANRTELASHVHRNVPRR